MICKDGASRSCWLLVIQIENGWNRLEWWGGDHAGGKKITCVPSFRVLYRIWDVHKSMMLPCFSALLRVKFLKKCSIPKFVSKILFWVWLNSRLLDCMLDDVALEYIPVARSWSCSTAPLIALMMHGWERWDAKKLEYKTVWRRSRKYGQRWSWSRK